MTTEQATITQPSDTEIVVVRDFDAPRELVWEAMNDPEHMKRWYGCEEAPLIECTNDVRVGGTYRNVTRLPDGTTFAFSGEYLEVDPPARIVFVERFEPIPGAESTVTSTFDERDRRTRFTLHMRFASKEACDGAIGSGMESGMLACYDRLDELVRTLR